MRPHELHQDAAKPVGDVDDQRNLLPPMSKMTPVVSDEIDVGSELRLDLIGVLLTQPYRQGRTRFEAVPRLGDGFPKLPQHTLREDLHID